MAREPDLTKGRDKLTERYRRYGDPRKGNKIPTSEQADKHTARIARRRERRAADEG